VQIFVSEPNLALIAFSAESRACFNRCKPPSEAALDPRVVGLRVKPGAKLLAIGGIVLHRLKSNNGSVQMIT
jgi:hypothetical protein